MRKDDIVIGQVYKTNYSGRVKVVGPAKKDAHSNTYDFPVKYLNNSGEEMHDGSLSSRDFVGRWTAEDDAKVERAQRNRLRSEELHNTLTFAGYPNTTISLLADGNVMLVFRGDDAKRVFKMLTGSEWDADLEEEEAEI